MPAATPLTDWGTRQQQLMAQLAAAEALKSKAIEQQPIGQMVSGHFIRNPWINNVTPYINQLRGSMEADKAQTALDEFNGAMQKDATDWMASRPQQAPAMGPPDADGNFSQPAGPTDQEKLSWAMRGMPNPLSKALAAAMAQDTLIEGPKRQDASDDKMALAKMQAAERRDIVQMQLQQRVDELRQRAEDSQLNREARIQAAQEANSLRRELAQMSIDARLQAAQIGTDARRDMAKLQPPKPVPENILKVMRGAQLQADNMDQVLQSYKPEYGGVGGMLSKTLGTWSPVSTKAQDDAANWWKQYQNQAALVERHEKFGTALSAGEQQAWRDATIAPGMTPQAIQRNLALRRSMAQKVYNSTLEQYKRAGYPQLGDAFAPIGEPAMTEPQGVPQAPQGAMPSVIQELSRLLPPGAKYIGPAQ